MEKPRGHRPSLLPITRFCGAAGMLAASGAAGSARAVKGSYFHAVCSGDTARAEALKLKLTERDLRDLEDWQSPGGVTVFGVELTYDRAFKEVPVKLYSGVWDELPCQPTAGLTTELLLEGTCDLVWEVIDTHGIRVAVVADIKSSAFSVPEGPESLQIQAYANAYCLERDINSYIPAIWAAKEGRWLFGDRVNVHFEDGIAVRKAIYAAATNTDPTPVTGGHCRQCYGRTRCSAFMLPAALPESWLTPLTEGKEVTGETAPALLVAMKALEDSLEIARERLKAFAAAEGGIPTTPGKVWAVSLQKGRLSFDKEKAKELLGDRFEECLKMGDPIEVARERKVR